MAVVTRKGTVIEAVIRLEKVISTREVIDCVYKKYPHKP